MGKCLLSCLWNELTDTDYSQNNSKSSPVLHNLSAKVLSITLWKASGSDTHYIASVHKHFSDLQDSHNFKLLKLMSSSLLLCTVLLWGKMSFLREYSALLRRLQKEVMNPWRIWSVFCPTQIQLQQFYITSKYRKSILFCFTMEFKFPKYLRLYPKIKIHLIFFFSPLTSVYFSSQWERSNIVLL